MRGGNSYSKLRAEPSAGAHTEAGCEFLQQRRVTRIAADSRGEAIPADVVHRVALAELRDRFATVVENVSDIPE